MSTVERLGGFWWCKCKLFILHKEFEESMFEVSAKRVCMITLLSLSHFMQKTRKQRLFKHPHAGMAAHRCITCMGILYEITENDNLILPFFTSLSSLLCRCSCGGCSCHSLCRHFSFPQGYRWHPLWLMCQRYWSQCHSI